MNFKKVFGAFVLFSVFAFSTSCEKQITSEVDEFYSLGKDELKDQDT